MDSRSCSLPLWGRAGVGALGRLIERCAYSNAGAGNSPRRASHFLCLAKESNQRKATPLAATLRFATGNLRCSLFAGSAQTRFAQTRAALIREKLRSSATARGDFDFNAPWRVLVWGAGERELQVLARAVLALALALALAHARIRTRSPAPVRGLAQRGRRRPSEAMARPTPLCACRGAQCCRPHACRRTGVFVI